MSILSKLLLNFDIQNFNKYLSHKNNILLFFCIDRDAATALKKLLETGCESVIITLGPKGAVYMSKQDQQAVHVLCDHVTPVDTTV